MERHQVIIVIPVYKCPDQKECTALRQCFQVLGKYEIAIIHPPGLETHVIREMHPSLLFTEMDAHWFRDIRAYNRLVLSSFFYKQFHEYKYMLIYQPDAYVFKDELLQWVAKGYDYIGAPWIPNSHKYEGKWGRSYLNFRRWWSHHILRKSVCSTDRHYRVGNGGFSLRKISRMIEVTSQYNNEIEYYLRTQKKFWGEDVFLCIYLRERAGLKIPSWEEALAFAFEINPRLAFKLNSHQLPFGCHDWSRKKRWEQFWKHYITLC